MEGASTLQKGEVATLFLLVVGPRGFCIVAVVCHREPQRSAGQRANPAAAFAGGGGGALSMLCTPAAARDAPGFCWLFRKGPCQSDVSNRNAALPCFAFHSPVARARTADEWFVERYTVATRVVLTETGWLYQIGRTLGRANRLADQRRATLLREEAKKMLAALLSRCAAPDASAQSGVV
jgi:hypothetical protein